MAGPLAEPITASIRIGAPPAEVYRYFTDADAMVTWMGQYARLDPTPGGEFCVDIEGSAVRGRYLELEAPHRIVFTWGFAGAEDLPPGGSIVEVRLTDDGDAGTLVTILHGGLSSSRAARHDLGWRHFLGRLLEALTAG